MFAQVVTFHRRPERLDDATRAFRERFGPHVSTQPGYRGAYILVDRQQGTQIGITLWETPEALRAATDGLTGPREQSAHELGDTAPPQRAVFEVVVHHVVGGDALQAALVDSQGGSPPAGSGRSGYGQTAPSLASGEHKLPTE